MSEDLSRDLSEDLSRGSKNIEVERVISDSPKKKILNIYEKFSIFILNFDRVKKINLDKSYGELLYISSEDGTLIDNFELFKNSNEIGIILSEERENIKVVLKRKELFWKPEGIIIIQRELKTIQMRISALLSKNFEADIEEVNLFDFEGNKHIFNKKDKKENIIKLYSFVYSVEYINQFSAALDKIDATYEGSKIDCKCYCCFTPTLKLSGFECEIYENFLYQGKTKLDEMNPEKENKFEIVKDKVDGLLKNIEIKQINKLPDNLVKALGEKSKIKQICFKFETFNEEFRNVVVVFALEADKNKIPDLKDLKVEKTEDNWLFWKSEVEGKKEKDSPASFKTFEIKIGFLINKN